MYKIYPDADGLIACRLCAERHPDGYFKVTALGGIDRRCKPCQNKRSKSRRQADIETFRKRDRDRRKRPDVNARVLEYARVYNRAQTPELKMWRSAKARAKKMGCAFTISVSDICIPETCPLLGTHIEKGKQRLRANSPSLDRFDNRRGYTPENVWVVSYRANAIKQNATIEELERIVSGLKRRQNS